VADLHQRLARHLRRLYLPADVRRAAEVKAAARLPFGQEWMQRYLGQKLQAAPSRLHQDLAADLRDLHTTRGTWRDYEAPRGAAKSTWLSVGYPLYCAVEGIERYTLLLSDSGDQAEVFLDALKAELEGNARLAKTYPGACGVGPVWKGDRLRLRNGCQVDAKGSGGRIRGRNNRGVRPSLVVVDDGNEKADAYSPTLRRRRWDWFTKDVMAVGTARTNFLVAGTPIHREAISHRLRTAPGWQARGYKAIARFPDRADLWAEWERLLFNLSDDARGDTARAFYDANRPAMDAGAEVLWPDWEPLYDLMRLRASIGPAAFDSEKQDRPGIDGATEWPAELFEWDAFHFDRWPGDLELKVQSLDPSKGTGSDSADYQAHVQLGLGADGTLYADADLRREHDFVGRMLDLAQAWGPHVVVAESNNTMGLLVPEIERQLAERRAAGRAVALNYEEVHHTLPKLARIRCLSGYISRRQLRVRNTPGGRMLAEQLRDVPNGEYDDAPDALSSAVRKLEEIVNGRQ
jgi:hypothetical protein